MKVGHPRDADPSITGQPHQVTDKVSDLMGEISCTHGHLTDMPAAVPSSTGTAAAPFPAIALIPAEDWPKTD